MSEGIYPCTIIRDRYRGAYSGGAWTAWNLYYREVPEEPDFGDPDAREFWENNKIPVGKGNTPEEAHSNLVIVLGKLPSAADLDAIANEELIGDATMNPCPQASTLVPSSDAGPIAPSPKTPS